MPPSRPATPPRNIHLVAICGTGMGALASLLQRGGYRVEGSDQNVYPPMSDQLTSAGIKLHVGYRAENLASDTDLVIVGNAVKKGHCEVEAARALSIPCLAMADALRVLFLTGRDPLVVAGTHGKTTTSFLLAHVLAGSGRDPGTFVGGVLQDGSGGARLGSGRDFVVEGDEYDNVFWDKTPKFLHYAPAAGIITSIEFDHADIYANLADIEKQFAEFAALIPANGHLLVAGDSPLAQRAAKRAACAVETYGTGLDDSWRAVQIEDRDGLTSFVLVSPEGTVGRCETVLAGEYNVINCVAALALAIRRGADPALATASLRSFTGTKRRQEVRGEADGVLIIDDFAHHPTAVARTLHALHTRYFDRGGKLWAIFEPRSATSCRRYHQNDYESAFDAAAKVLIAPNARSAQIPAEERFDPARLVAGLRQLSIDAHCLNRTDEFVAKIVAEARPGDVVAILSNGGFDGIHERLLLALQARATRPRRRAATA